MVMVRSILSYNSDTHLTIIPTYNEADNIEKFIEEVSKLDISILFVDDNSPDGTGEIIKKKSLNNDQIYLIERPSKLGLGSAYRDGFSWGIEKNFKFFIEMDADFSHQFKDLEKINFSSTLSDGYSFQIEMTIRSVENKLNIKEIPIIFNERLLGNSKMSKKIILEAFSFLIKNGIKRWLNLKIS